MFRYLAVLFLLIPGLFTRAQLLHNPIPASYNTDMQRLLVIATANYVYGICQGQLNKDSAVLFSAATFGLSRLMAYNEDFATGKDYPGCQLIDSGKTAIATQRLSALKGDPKLQLLAELGIYYLHRQGNDLSNIDSATFFIERLYQAGNISPDKWLPRSLWLLGMLNDKKGDTTKSRQYFEQATALCRKAGNAKMIATSLLHQAENLPSSNTKKEGYLQEALAICKKEKLPYLQYRIMIVALLDHTHSRPQVVLNEMQEALAFEKQIGFLHNQYAYCSLSYWYTMKGELVQARLNAEQAVASMEATKDTALSTVYCMRMCEIHANAGDMQTAMYWNTRALSIPKSRYTQVFWFKSVLDRIRLLNEQGLYSEALQVARDFNHRFPPMNDFDKMHLAYNMGYCYEKVGQDNEALSHYLQFLDIAARFPPQFAYTEILTAYNQVAVFYFRKGDYVTARQYAMRILNDPLGEVGAPYLGMAHHLLFRLDSVAGNYVSAIQHYQKFHRFADSTYSISQRKKMDELTIQYETKKKDQDIRILTQDSQLQKEKLARSSIMSNITLAGIAVLLIIMGLLYNQYRIKQKANRKTLAKNETLQQLVEEKEWLLREVHHRVKNNLQTIVSLLESQSTYLKNEALLAIQESQNRIHAMSLIHQKLYHNENISSVNIGDYLPELLQYLWDSYDVTKKISLHQLVQDADLDVSQAIPLGLIVNEAVTNAIKHAFPQSRSSDSITISFMMEDETHAKLCISDNGIGIAPGILNSKIPGLGLKLIRGLAKDIGASLDMRSNGGTSITIAFEISRPLKSATEDPMPHIFKASL